MLESLLPYYERELSYLRELSGEFARRYPKVAGRLQLEGDQCEDPHTERLIESFAFLSARIHRKLDDEYPEISASFLEVLYPHYMRPIPASSIVQFEFDAQRPEVARRYQIERGQPVHAPPVHGTVCKFRTCYPVTLYPLALTQVRLELTSGSTALRRVAPDAIAVLTLELKTHGDLDIGTIGLDSLRFFLDGEPALMHLLYQSLLSHSMGVRVSNGNDAREIAQKLPPSHIQPVGFGRDEGMLEYDERSFLGYRLLTEYFSFPEKFLFVDFTGLEKVVTKGWGNTLVIQCLIKHYPDSERHNRLINALSTTHLKLGCTPIVNLFTQAAEPVRLTHQKASYPVFADNRRQNAYEIIQIKRVVRVEKTDIEELSDEVLPFYAIRHGERQEGARFYWHASRENSPRAGDRGTDVELHLVDLNFSPVHAATEVLSLDLLCSNRDLPEYIPFGGNQSSQNTDFSLIGHSVIKRVRLLRKPTTTLRPPQRRGLQWRLISHLSLNYMSLVENGKNALQEMLALYNFTDSAATNRQIQGICNIASSPAITRVLGRDFAGFVRGTEITLTLDESFYVGGSLYLFACVLERFFALYCAPNSFTRLRVCTPQQQDQEVATWPARCGEALVI